jgi:RNA polymerase sigma-70 factor, ECF subfamily
MSPQDFQSKILPVKNKLFRFSLRIVNDATEAEDIVQEVFINLWKNREHICQISNVEAWCMTATRNLSIDKLRSKHKRVDGIKPGFDLQDKAPDPYRQTVTNDIIGLVKKMMEQLPEKQKHIMHLRDIEGLSYQEIAGALELSLDQVKVNLFRARKAIRAQLLKYELRSSR